MLYTPNNILYKYIRYRFRRIQIQCNMLYDIAPEEEDEICRNLLKKRAKILIPVGILYFLLFGVIFAWLVGTRIKSVNAMGIKCDRLCDTHFKYHRY